MNRFFLLSLFLGGFFLFIPKAFADSTTTVQNCQPIYGGGQTCVQSGNLLINKTVQNPQTGQFVDNLGVNYPEFGPNQSVTLQIALTNTGGSTLSNINVQDIFPQFVAFISGNGNFNS